MLKMALFYLDCFCGQDGDIFEITYIPVIKNTLSLNLFKND